MTTSQATERLLEEQIASWKTAYDNYAALSGVLVREIEVGRTTFKAQFNPARIVSSGAKVDARSISERRCFLCAENRPAEQHEVDFGERYTILVNPFPIFPRHLTIPDKAHTEQLIGGRFGDMLDLAKALPDYTIFYNGPRCGASAPDHAHFQAGNKGFMPIESDWRKMRCQKIVESGGTVLLRVDDGTPRTMLVVESAEREGAVRMFETIYSALTVKEGEQEPMMNVLAMYEDGKWVVFIFPRAKHRPDCYFAEGDDKMLISPASVDLGGVFIFPLERDFSRITAEEIMQILSEVSLSPAELDRVSAKIVAAYSCGGRPTVQVGILSGERIEFVLHGEYICDGETVEGEHFVTADGGRVVWNGKIGAEIVFEPRNPAEDSFDLADVTIGIGFHWERREVQRFRGALKFIVDEGRLTAVNVVDVEEYLTSVISSEMRATASPDLLKAHAVISRSWLLSQIRKSGKGNASQCGCRCDDSDEIIRGFSPVVKK